MYKSAFTLFNTCSNINIYVILFKNNIITIIILFIFFLFYFQYIYIYIENLITKYVTLYNIYKYQFLK